MENRVIKFNSIKSRIAEYEEGKNFENPSPKNISR